MALRLNAAGHLHRRTTESIILILHAAAVLEKLAAWNHGSIYKTKPFEAMLEKVFSSRPIFGGASDDDEMFAKVAITTTSSVAQHAVVIANYNRPDPTEYGENILNKLGTTI